jgi:alpha-D-ribose 1-methylphosphonate 5-triphosphate synthase subunit PhnH
MKEKTELNEVHYNLPRTIINRKWVENVKNCARGVFILVYTNNSFLKIPRYSNE